MTGIISDNLGRSSGLLKAAGGGGKILQVVAGPEIGVSTTTTSNSWAAMNLEVDITPSATSSKIFVAAMFMSRAQDGSGSHNNARFTLYRDSTNLGDANGGLHANVGNGRVMECTVIYLDSPSTTSSVKYEIYARCFSSRAIIIGDGDGSVLPHQVIYAFEVDGS